MSLACSFHMQMSPINNHPSIEYIARREDLSPPPRLSLTSRSFLTHSPTYPRTYPPIEEIMSYFFSPEGGFSCMFFLPNSIFSMPKFIKHNNSLLPQRAGASIYMELPSQIEIAIQINKERQPRKNSKSNSLKQLPPAAALIQGDTNGNNHLKGGNPNGLHTVSHSQDTVQWCSSSPTNSSSAEQCKCSSLPV